MRKVSYYEILDLEITATAEEIKQAYRFYSAALHPDKHSGSNKQRAEEKMKALNEAYQVLSNPQKRAEYDRKLADRHRAEENQQQAEEEQRRREEESRRRENQQRAEEARRRREAEAQAAEERRWRAQRFAQVFGAIYLLVGILGLLPFLLTPPAVSWGPLSGETSPVTTGSVGLVVI